MTCALTECPYGRNSKRTSRVGCYGCPHFVPPPYVTAWCMLWDRDKVLCTKPKSACEGCPEKALYRTLGRPNLSGFDHTTKDGRAEYAKHHRQEVPPAPRDRAEYMRQYAKDHRDRLKVYQREYKKKQRRRVVKGE